jgi:hypothetical protein
MVDCFCSLDPGSAFFWVQNLVKMQKQNKREYSITISFFLKKNHQISNLFFKKNWPHLDSGFNLVFFFLLFREAFKTCCHLMLNSSWDASQ